jgi:hypothetical protein
VDEVQQDEAEPINGEVDPAAQAEEIAVEMAVPQAPHHPLAADLDDAIYAVRRRPMKFPKYAEGLSMPDYMASVRHVTEYNQWTEAEGAMQLRASLEGKALRLALSHPNADLTELAELFTTRFAEERSVAWNMALDLKWSKGQSVEDLGDEVRRLTQLAFAGMRAADQEAQAIAVFTRALDQPTITFQLEIMRVETLREAVQVAKKMDACRKRRGVPAQQGGEGKPTLRTLEVDTDEEVECTAGGSGDQVTALRAELRQLRSDLAGQSAGDNVICHRCQGNHFVRGCPQGWTPGGRPGGGNSKPRQTGQNTQTKGAKGSPPASGNA